MYRKSFYFIEITDNLYQNGRALLSRSTSRFLIVKTARIIFPGCVTHPEQKPEETLSARKKDRKKTVGRRPQNIADLMQPPPQQVQQFRYHPHQYPHHPYRQYRFPYLLLLLRCYRHHRNTVHRCYRTPGDREQNEHW